MTTGLSRLVTGYLLLDGYRQMNREWLGQILRVGGIDNALVLVIIIEKLCSGDGFEYLWISLIKHKKKVYIYFSISCREGGLERCIY